MLQTVIKLFLALFLFTLPCLAQTYTINDWVGQTAGTALTGTNMTASAHCLSPSSWQATSITTTTYVASPFSGFPGIYSCGGASYNGNTGVAVNIDTATTDRFAINLGGGQGANVAFGAPFEITAASPVSGDGCDLMNIQGTGDGIYMQEHLTGSDLFIQMEKSIPGSSTAWGHVSISQNHLYYFTVVRISGGTHLAAVYDLQTSPPTQLAGSPISIPASLSGNPSTVITGFGGSCAHGGHLIWGPEIIDRSGVGLILPNSPWSGIIAANRAMDWSSAGVAGGIPSATYTQCGATVTAGTDAPAITTQLATCGLNQFVLLGPGTFNLSTAINIPNANGHLVLRGSGANSTFLVYNSGATSATCANGTGICLKGSDGTFYNPEPSALYEWTAGYAQGTNQITLASSSGCTLGSTCPITLNSTVLVLEQCEDGFSGDTCATGGAGTDNGNYFNESVGYNSVGPVGASFDGPDSGNGTALRFETEMATATAFNTSTGVATLSHPLRNSNWRSGQTPHVWRFNPTQYVGIENLSMDFTNDSTPQSAIQFSRVANVWVTGVKIAPEPFYGVYCFICYKYQFEQNYIDGTNSTHDAPVQVPHAINVTLGGDGLVQNNIFKRVTTPIHEEGSTNGTVIGYNHCVNDYTASNNMGESARPHSNGDNFILYEGNTCQTLYADNTHGTETFFTYFRNFAPGWDSCGNGQCGVSTAKQYHANPFLLSSYAREHNYVGNVAGTLGFHTTYQIVAPGNGGGNNRIWVLGEGGGNNNVPGDSLVSTSILRWGNYDVVTGGTRWCGNSSDTGWVATCGSTSEIPTATPVFPNSVPTVGDTGIGQPALPASFYLSAKPAWFQTLPWPPIGPDVTSGNVGQCTGVINTVGQMAKVAALNSAQCIGTTLTASQWGGHVNANPAMQCYLLVMGGTVDGTGPALPFNPSLCYANVPAPIATFTPSSVNFGNVPAGLTSNPIPVTLQNTGAANLPVSTVSLGSAVFSLINNTCGSPATITNTIPGTGFTLTPGASCTFNVIYQPVVPNFTNTASVFFSPGASNPDALSLTGNSTGPSAPSIINFAGNFTSSGTAVMK